MTGVVLSVILILALILGVYIFGAYTASKESNDIDIEVKNTDKSIIIQIVHDVILSFIIVFVFAFSFELIGFKQEQMGIGVAIIVVFTIIFCTNKIIAEIKKIKESEE